jgi:hypothetical protein
MLDKIIEVIASVPPSAIITALLAIGVSAVMQKFKKWFALQSDRVINVILIALSFLTVGINALMESAAQNPALLGRNTMFFLGVVITMYTHIVKPANGFMADVKEYRARKDRVAASAVQPDVVVPTEAALANEFPA